MTGTEPDDKGASVQAQQLEPKERLASNDIKPQLLSRLQEALLYLFPNGNIRRGNFIIGDVRGNKGESLVVDLAGEQAGLWHDFATGEGGDILSLWGAVHNLDHRSKFPEILRSAREWLGIPVRPAPIKSTSTKSKDLGPHTGKWDYLDAQGKVIASVFRYDPPEGKEFRPWDARLKCWRSPKPRPLYNQPGLLSSSSAVLVEGEKCAEALIKKGICATTAMNGANAPIDKTDWSPLIGKNVTIWPDNDKAGKQYARAVAKHLRTVGIASLAILVVPNGKPQKWDAADAVKEGLDITAFLATAQRKQDDLSPNAALSAETDDDSLLPVGLTEDALADDFTQRHANDWRYVAGWGHWLFWIGCRWEKENTLKAYDLARLICRNAATSCENPKIAAKLSAASTVAAVERMARADRRHAATIDIWDCDLWLLNTPGGVVDLRTGHLIPHDRQQAMTKITIATPKGDCPLWRQFLATVTGNNQDLQSYLQRVAGYILTGVTSEHAMFFFYGTGANGKSVYANTLTAILGDYATVAAMDMFMATTSDRHPTDMAGLRGARVVTSIETEQGRRWAESKIKALTGGDKITARFMRQDFFEFIPQFKLLIAGNHKPAIRNVDEAMRRRLHMVPFIITIPPEKRDKQLSDRLLAERDGILAWAVEGCLEWQRNGLMPPAAVMAATEEYFAAEDALGRWLDERCERGNSYSESTSALFADWKTWAEQCGEFVGSIKRFAENLINRKLEPYRDRSSRGFRGIRLREGTRNTEEMEF